MRISEFIFLVFISMAAVGFCLHGWLIMEYSWTVLMMPVCVSASLLLFSTFRILRTLQTSPSDPEAALLLQYWQQLRVTSGGAIWCMLVLPVLGVFGYPLGLSLFAAAYAKGHGSSWSTSLVFGSLVMALVWGLAVKILALPLDFLPGWLG